MVHAGRDRLLPDVQVQEAGQPARFHQLACRLLEEPDPDHTPVEVVDDGWSDQSVGPAENPWSGGGSDLIGTKSPETAIIGYMMTAPIGCAKRAVGTMLAMRKPIDRMLQVLIRSAIVKPNNGT